MKKIGLIITAIFLAHIVFSAYNFIGDSLCIDNKGDYIINTLVTDTNPGRFGRRLEESDFINKEFKDRSESFIVSLIDNDLPFVAEWKVTFLDTNKSYYVDTSYSCLFKKDFKIITIENYKN